MSRTLVPTAGMAADEIPGLPARYGDEGALGPEGGLWFRNPVYNPPVVRGPSTLQVSSPSFGEGAFGQEGTLWFTKPAYNPGAKQE